MRNGPQSTATWCSQRHWGGARGKIPRGGGLGFDAGGIWPLGYVPPYTGWVILSKSFDIWIQATSSEN